MPTRLTMDDLTRLTIRRMVASATSLALKSQEEEAFFETHSTFNSRHGLNPLLERAARILIEDSHFDLRKSEAIELGREFIKYFDALDQHKTPPFNAIRLKPILAALNNAMDDLEC